MTGGSSTPRLFASIISALEYWVARSRPGRRVDMRRRSRDSVCPSHPENSALKSRGRGAPFKGGRGECRVRAAPAARVLQNAHGSHHRYPGTPGIPCAMVLTVSFALSPATNSSCHRRQRIDDSSNARLGSKISAGLTSATDARTTRLRRTQRPFVTPSIGKCAAGRKSGEGIKAPFVLRAGDRSQAKARPAIPSRARRCRVHRIPPHVTTIMIRPSVRVGRVWIKR
jgi:hypothetical protein